MNNKCFFLVLLMLIAGSSKSQQADSLILFEKQQTVYLMADSVNIRKEPTMESALVTKLPIGTKLLILDKSKFVSRINNIPMPWYLVQFNGNQKGYVWGGKIAINSVKSNKNPDIVFHFGMDKIEDKIATYQIRVEQLGKEIQRLTFKGFGGYLKQHTCTNISNKGLSNVDDIIQVDGFAEACGEEAGSIIFFWANNKLTFIERQYSVMDAPTFGKTYFIYPSDMLGKKDIIIKKEEEGDMLFDETQPNTWYSNSIKYDKNIATEYKWDGSKLIKIK